jgi:hypothetical protein
MISALTSVLVVDRFIDAKTPYMAAITIDKMPMTTVNSNTLKPRSVLSILFAAIA